MLVVVLVLLVVVLPVLLVLVPFAAAAAVIKGSGGNGRRACSGVTCDHDVLRRCAMATDCPARAAIGYVEPISSDLRFGEKKRPRWKALEGMLALLEQKETHGRLLPAEGFLVPFSWQNRAV